MTIFERLKSWFAPKPAQPVPKVIEQVLPNGRTALTDEKGNFLEFKKSN